jgi:adenosine deaminase
MANILICTLGASWAVIPEVYGFINSKNLPLYQNAANFESLKSSIDEFSLQPVDEIWICTTQGEATCASLDKLKEWLALLSPSVIARIWQAEKTQNLATQAECQHVQELILRTTLAAHHYSNGGQVLLSLAGGRKTMSADMQWAAGVFGCNALLHVIGVDYRDMPEEMRAAKPEIFTKPLDKASAESITPMITGSMVRSDLLDVKMDSMVPISPDDYPLPLPQNQDIVVWPTPDRWLNEELKYREKMGSQLLGNYYLELSFKEQHENWRSLYRLPPDVINRFRETPLNLEHQKALNNLPKADLHRHLGGCLNLDEQRSVAHSIWSSMSASEQDWSLKQVQSLLKNNSDWGWDWTSLLKESPQRPFLASTLLIEATESQLINNLWGVTEPRVGLKNSLHGFSAYERPGELTGSTLLSSPYGIERYAQAVVQQCVNEGLLYVELRGSPQKYGDGLLFLKSFYQAIQSALDEIPKARLRPILKFIIIADRRKSEEQLKQTIAMGVSAKELLPDFVVGLDMAGDESYPISTQISELFLPAFQACLPITIHAGEGEKAESIWQAAYLLHADRIGHGLTLNDNQELAERFRNRGICLELCPTSNVEVVGFNVPDDSTTDRYPVYPLMQLWRKGLPLTLCTDNPGISCTTLTNEYIKAAVMSQGELTIWDALAMIKQGFSHGFLSGKEKEQLLKQCDALIYQQLICDPFFQGH